MDFLEIREGNEHGTVVLVGNTMLFDSTVGGQFFDIPPNWLRARAPDEPIETHIALQFPSKNSLEMSARLFKEGFTNKEKFKASIVTLLDKKRITKEEHVKLLNLINSCDCGPTLIRQKVRDAGLGKILSEKDFDFEDPHHDHARPIEFLWSWIEKRIPKEGKEPAAVIKKEPETKSVAKRVAALKTKIFKGPEGDKKQEYTGEARSAAEAREEENRAIAEVREEETGTKEKPKKGRKKKS